MRPISNVTLWKRFRRTCAAGDKAVGLLAKDAPSTWVDDFGEVRRTPQSIGRLKPGKNKGHAALREYVIRRDGKCAWCQSTRMLVADHIISRKNGGAHHPTNLRAMCDPCNAAKVGLVDARQSRGAL